jgi:hypothetical protein
VTRGASRDIDLKAKDKKHPAGVGLGDFHNISTAVEIVAKGKFAR